jgi:hypothetical protein
MRTRRRSKRTVSPRVAGHSGGLTAAVAAGEQAGQVPGVEDGGVWPDKDDRGGQNGADVLALRHPGDQLAGEVGDEDSALADARAEYLVVGDLIFLRWGNRPDQVASGDDGPADLREAALLNDSPGCGSADEVGQQMRQFREQGLETGAVAGQEVE